MTLSVGGLVRVNWLETAAAAQQSGESYVKAVKMIEKNLQKEVKDGERSTVIGVESHSRFNRHPRRVGFKVRDWFMSQCVDFYDYRVQFKQMKDFCSQLINSTFNPPTKEVLGFITGFQSLFGTTLLEWCGRWCTRPTSAALTTLIPFSYSCTVLLQSTGIE